MNISSSSLAINKLRRLPATSVIDLPWSVAAECIALGGRTVQFTALDGARYCLTISIFA